ncbi:MAG: hypothetical protein ACTSQT_03475, partial [Promethearchaeota archaeon]
VKLFQDIIHKNDEYIEVNNKYVDSIKDLAVKKDYLVEKKYEFASALGEVANKRSVVIKKALSVEKKKNDLIEGEKMKLLESELNDSQRDFDRARDILLKKIDQFLQVKNEVDDLWVNLKNSVDKAS